MDWLCASNVAGRDEEGERGDMMGKCVGGRPQTEEGMVRIPLSSKQKDQHQHKAKEKTASRFKFLLTQNHTLFACFSCLLQSCSMRILSEASP